MYFKIAVGNVKKSFRDYTIYFLTLTLAVSIFYSFNSIESQKAILEISSKEALYIDLVTTIISYMSVFVSVILGSLIIYASNFLIKKRKKELGIYMTLGMGKGKISKILVMETAIVGVLSLISGLVVGLILSQGLSVLTSKMFAVGMGDYKFIISTSAIGKTVLYFGIIFILVMLFNTRIIAKYKIIDLLTSGRKNESVKFKSPFVYLITFILSVISIGTAYAIILDIGLMVDDPKFLLSIILGIVGTILFFFSLAGFTLYVVKRSEKVYFKGLNIFIVKQINSKINTNFISVSIICVMLFFTMTILSTGISFKNALESGLKETTPFDASATTYVNKGDEVKPIKNSIEKAGFKFDSNVRYAEYSEYYLGENINTILNLDDETTKKLDKLVILRAVGIKASEYNNVRKLEGKDAIDLKENEVLVTSNNDKIVPIVNDYLKNNKTMNIKGKTYEIKNDKVITDSIETTGFKGNMFTLIVNDKIIDESNIEANHININFNGENKNKIEEELSKVFNDFRDGKFSYDEAGFIVGYTRDDVYAENKGMTTTILFIGIYLGIVFLISSMAVLAIQQLSEASDSIERYKSLKRIGANDKMINKTIFIQTLIYFSLPIILAFIHSVVGIKVTGEFVSMYSQSNILMSSIITAIGFIIVYLIYFYATYIGYKNIVKNS